MFSVKFCCYFDDGSQTTTSISCPHYSVYKRKNGTYTVTTYQKMTDIDGVERHIVKDVENETVEKSTYHCCYVENQSGKTIEHIKS